LDDILIYSINEKDYTKQVNLILEALKKAGIRINRLKCIFYAKKIEFLSYIVGLNGIKMDPKKV
jgi:hypothetical protein